MHSAEQNAQKGFWEENGFNTTEVVTCPCLLLLCSKRPSSPTEEAARVE